MPRLISSTLGLLLILTLAASMDSPTSTAQLIDQAEFQGTPATPTRTPTIPPTATPEPTPTASPERTPTPTAESPPPSATPQPSSAPTVDPTATPRPAREPPPATGQAFRCPMLYYHEVPGQAGLAAQLTAFLQAGYRPVTMGRVVDALEGRAPPPSGCLVLTFDDGLASQMTGALPVLVRYGVPATFFVMPSFRDGVHRYMGAEDFRALREAGMEIGSHTLNHVSLPSLLRVNYGAFSSEIVQSKGLLEEVLGELVDLLAYPNGAWDRATAEELQKAGYRAAATTMPGGLQRPQELFSLRRIRADPWEPPATVLRRLTG